MADGRRKEEVWEAGAGNREGLAIRSTSRQGDILFGEGADGKAQPPG
jgi:hypothetical protein